MQRKWGGNLQALRRWEHKENGEVERRAFFQREHGKRARAGTQHFIDGNAEKFERETAKHFIVGQTEKRRGSWVALGSHVIRTVLRLHLMRLPLGVLTAPEYHYKVVDKCRA